MMNISGRRGGKEEVYIPFLFRQKFVFCLLGCFYTYMLSTMSEFDNKKKVGAFQEVVRYLHKGFFVCGETEDI